MDRILRRSLEIEMESNAWQQLLSQAYLKRRLGSVQKLTVLLLTVFLLSVLRLLQASRPFRRRQSKLHLQCKCQDLSAFMPLIVLARHSMPERRLCVEIPAMYVFPNKDCNAQSWLREKFSWDCPLILQNVVRNHACAAISTGFLAVSVRIDQQKRFFSKVGKLQDAQQACKSSQATIWTVERILLFLFHISCFRPLKESYCSCCVSLVSDRHNAVQYR